MQINISEINIGTRLRTARKANEIAESIKEIGLLNPITLDREYNLVAGLNRLEACKLLGHTSIECHFTDLTGLKLQLAEIDENLIRDDLTVIENCNWLSKRKDLYLEIYPQTAHGGDRKSMEYQNAESASWSETPSFTESTAALTNVSKRTVETNIAIATNLKEFDLEGLDIADSKTDLIELAKIAKTNQEQAHEIVEQIKSGVVSTVKEAVEQMSIKKSGVLATLHTGDEESYTPSKYIESARVVMGNIDLDPASNDIAQATVMAEVYFKFDDDGLSKHWEGNVWMNPPYTSLIINKFIDKLITHYISGEVSEAIVLTNNNTDTSWFHLAAKHSSAICFTKGRINFLKPDGTKSSPTNGQSFIYFGENVEKFKDEFSKHGLVMGKL